MPGSLLTASEVAELLKVNVETVYGLIQKDGLPAAKVGGQWRFSEEKVRAWFEARHVSELAASADREETEKTDSGIRLEAQELHAKAWRGRAHDTNPKAPR